MTSIRLLAYIFFRRQFGYTSFRLGIKFSTIPVYAYTCACPDKAAQMYFGSMNYTTHIYIISNYHIVINQLFHLHGLPALGRRFPERLTTTSGLISTFDCFFIRLYTVTEIHVYYDDATGTLIQCRQIMRPILRLYPRLDLQLIKTHLCKTWE